MGGLSIRTTRWRAFVVFLAVGLLGASAAAGSASAAQPTSWVPLSPKTSPITRGGASMAFDPAINKMVLFGGAGPRSECGCLSDTWTYDGNTWTQQFPAEPTARAGAAMAYDPALRKIVLFSGNNFQADTWTYDGATWTKETPTTSPPALAEASMAFDPRIGRLVLFGGNGGSPGCAPRHGPTTV